MTYRISEISAASPDMSDEAFRELVESIREHGQLVPIWKSGDEIIDGRKRMRACGVLGIEPVVVDVSPTQDAEAVAYSLNILRTHYTAGQRAMFQAARATLTRSDGPARRRTPEQEFGKSVPELATEAAVAPSRIFAAKAVRRDGAPEVIAAVESGRLALNAAERIVKMPRASQPAALAELDAPSRVTDKSSGFKRSPSRPLAWRVQRALDQLENAVESLTEFLSEPSARRAPEFQAWAEQIGAAKTQLGRILSTRRTA